MNPIDHIYKQKIIKDILTATKESEVVINMTDQNLTAFVVQAIHKEKERSLFVFDDIKHLETCKNSLVYMDDDRINVFYESIAGNKDIKEFATQESEQYETGIKNISNNKEGVYIATLNSINDPAPKINKVKTIKIKTGEDIVRSDLLPKLEKWGYKNADWCVSRKMYAVRGGIVDIFPSLEKHPVRIEFDGNTVISIRKFDIGTQESIEQTQKIDIQQPMVIEKSVSDNKLYDILCNRVDKILYITHINQPKVLEKLPVFDIFSEDFSYINKKTVDTHKNLVNISKKVRGVFVYGKTTLDHPNAIATEGSLKSNILSRDLDILLVGDGKQPQKRGPIEIGGVKQKKVYKLDDIHWGDVLVHQDYGLGIYRGLEIVGGKNSGEENIKIEYPGGSSVYVPINKFDRIHKYIGIGGAEPKLTQIGTGAWEKQKLTTKKSVEKVVDYLIQNYMNKQKPRGFEYSGDKELIKRVVDGFPYKETPDQSKAIDDVYKDLKTDKPMDRLIYGDVGFGKTEVAIRAAIMAISSGRVVFFLAPTTVLSDQHYINCVNRLSPAGVSVELLSRFKSKKQQRGILEKYEQGGVDLLVGTHRLLSTDVKTDRLGLLIIDEEHRFGVKHKEVIRKMKGRVDVLTLTATPIPRTLQQSLVGIRDTSKIETPPQNRQPIKTYIRRFDWVDIKNKIEYEIGRGGQVYFVHNKIESMPFVVDKISTMFPNIVVRGAHGQMPSGPLEKTVLGFFNKKVDVLVCTTIIESGLDVVNANTIIVNDSQNFGLSQLYQIRGRVGRGNRQAFCYLYIPKKIKLLPDAYKRLKTLEYYTSLGSGYGVAIKDLEIRGAGNIFGHEQSGQMLRVGLDLYNKILSDVLSDRSGDLVLEQKKEVVINTNLRAFINKDYMPLAQDRLNYYQQISSAATEKEVDEIKKRLEDQFGPTEHETEDLFVIAKIRSLLDGAFIKKCFVDRSVIKITIGESVGVSVDDIIKKVGEVAQKNKLTHKFEKTRLGLCVVFEKEENVDWVVVVRDFAVLFSGVDVG